MPLVHLGQFAAARSALFRIFRFFRSRTGEYAAGSRLEKWSARARAAGATERTRQNALQRADGLGVMPSPGTGARGATARRWCLRLVSGL